VGLIAGIILSTVVLAMIGGKLVCVVTSRCRKHRALVVGDAGMDTDEQRDMLSATVDDLTHSVDVTIDDPSCGQ